MVLLTTGLLCKVTRNSGPGYEAKLLAYFKPADYSFKTR